MRPVRHEDEPFIFSIFIGSRPDLEWISGINKDVKDSLISQQFRCEQEQMLREYPEGDFRIILLDGEPVGRLCVHRGMDVFRIINISLLHEYRGRGIGGKLIAGIQEEAREAGKRVSLQVAWYNSATRALYEKMGFVVIEDAGVCCEMQWTSL
ncbi:MAG: Acetyltransferase (GNAT) family protein [Pelotomaculum sp. PtaU1.Bin035]|nr:MAG: Acetyltransferase (GNAT) family protein [Pelotomaculum sp. PtaU1.Bin035]